MSKTTTKPSLKRRIRRWQVPALAMVMGIVFLLGGAARGRIGLGLAMAAIMFAYALFLISFSRSNEAVALLRDESVDERRAQIQLRANAMVGNVLITAVLGIFLVQFFRGEDTLIWAALGAAGGVTYVVTALVLSRRG
jgi:Na+/H+ antiporter NhaD/arsenite permease-like protein